MQARAGAAASSAPRRGALLAARRRPQPAGAAALSARQAVRLHPRCGSAAPALRGCPRAGRGRAAAAAACGGQQPAVPPPSRSPFVSLFVSLPSLVSVASAARRASDRAACWICRQQAEKRAELEEARRRVLRAFKEDRLRRTPPEEGAQQLPVHTLCDPDRASRERGAPGGLRGAAGAVAAAKPR